VAKQSDAHLDCSDYHEMLDLMQAMFRSQHSDRFVFSYNLCASDPTKVRAILKELEDIIVLDEIPTMCYMDNFKRNVLQQVRWSVVFKRKNNDANGLPLFELTVDAVDAQQIEEIKADESINIDYNSMLYKKTASKIKDLHFLVTMNEDELTGFGWAVWKNLSTNAANPKWRPIPGTPQSKGFWHITHGDDAQLEREAVTHRHLDAILAILHHKKLRTQFDGEILSESPMQIKLEDKMYFVSWWNMARMTRCNAVTVNGHHFLHIRKPLDDEKLEWFWYDNDAGQVRVFDNSTVPQLEYSYQASLDINFPESTIDFNNYEESELFNQKWNPHIIDETKEAKDEDDDEEEEKAQVTHRLMKTLRSVSRSPERRLFNQCMLTDLMAYMEREHGHDDPKYVLRFEFNQQQQIYAMTQLRVGHGAPFGREVQRFYNGRNSAWPTI